MTASKAAQAATAQRRAQAVQMRVAGVSWDLIASRLGYSGKAAACKDVTRALERARAETAEATEQLRQLEAARLDRLQAGLWTSACAGDTRAVDVALKIIDRRVKLLGLDGAQRVIDNAVDAWLTHLTHSAAPESEPPALDPVLETIPET